MWHKIKVRFNRLRMDDCTFKRWSEQEFGRRSLAQYRQRARRKIFMEWFNGPADPYRLSSTPFRSDCWGADDPNLELPAQVRAAADKANSYYTGAPAQ